MSNNLDLPQIAENQNHKEITSNDADGALDAALTEVLSLDLSSNVSLTDAQYRGAIFFSIDTSAAAHTLTIPAIKRLVVVANTTINDVDIVRGSTTETLAAGDRAIIYTDGTTDGMTVMKLAASGGVDPFDMMMFFPGAPGDAALMVRLVASFEFTLPSGLSGSYASGTTVSTGTPATLTMKKNGSSIGTINFNASATGTFTFASDVTFSVGDVLTIENQATADATLTNISISLKGTK